MPTAAVTFHHGVESDHSAFWFHASWGPSRCLGGTVPTSQQHTRPSHSGPLPATLTTHRPSQHTLCAEATPCHLTPTQNEGLGLPVLSPGHSVRRTVLGPGPPCLSLGAQDPGEMSTLNGIP